MLAMILKPLTFHSSYVCGSLFPPSLPPCLSHAIIGFNLSHQIES